jgi:hypothetical protein
MPQRKRKKQEGPSLQAATGIAAVAGGTGLFAAALALQRRPVRVPVPQTDLNDTDQAPAEITPCSDRNVCHVDNMKKKAASDEYLDTLIRNMVDSTIRSTGVVFTSAGRRHTQNILRSYFMDPENEWMLKSPDGDYSSLEDYINQTVSQFSTISGIFALK